MLRHFRSIDLSAPVIKECIQRVKIKPEEVQEVNYGLSIIAEAALETDVPARQATLRAGLPPENISLTVNRACCSSLSALRLGYRAIRSGDLDIALAVDADGLHVGQGDLPVKVARQLLPLDKILGISTTTVEQAVAGLAEGADHVAVGSIYPTPTKKTAVGVGLERLRQVRQAVSVPLVAIGGINKDNVADVIAAGADSVAVISAVLAADSPETAARQIAEKFEAR